MIPILLTILAVIHGYNCRGEGGLMASVADDIMCKIIGFGTPNHPYNEDKDNMEAFCNKMSKQFLAPTKKIFDREFKGLTLELIHKVFDYFIEKKTKACRIVKEKGIDEWVEVAKEMNSKMDEASKVRLQLIKVFDDMDKPDSPMTWSKFYCLCEKFKKTYISVFDDKPKAKEFASSETHFMWDEMLYEVTKKVHKEEEDSECELPDVPDTNPTPYESFIIPMFYGYAALDKKSHHG